MMSILIFLDLLFVVKTDDVGNAALTLLAAHIIDTLHLVGIVGDMADGQVLLGTDDQTATFALGLADIVQLSIVHQMALVEGFNHLGIFAQ